MSFLKLLVDIMWPNAPPVRVNPTRDDDLHEASATRGTLIIGDPSSGKTRYAAMQIFQRWKKNPHPVFVFDWSGGITNCLLDLIARDKNHEKLLEKVVLDEIGNEERVVPKPEFHPAYGLTDEEQVSRVVGNMENLGEYLSRTAGFVSGISIQEIAKQLFRLLQVIRNEHGENFQITEARDLITDQAKLKRACQKFGGYAIEAKKFFEREYLPKEAMNPHDKYLMTATLRTLLGHIDGRVARATLGYFKPGWTPKEADENDLLVIVDAHGAINTEAAQHWLLTSPFSQVMY
jgi:hypothetical protein